MRLVIPAPISIVTPEITPSVTPMRPTPLVGNWGDLPCPWDESRLAHLTRPQTPPPQQPRSPQQPCAVFTPIPGTRLVETTLMVPLSHSIPCSPPSYDQISSNDPSIMSNAMTSSATTSSTTAPPPRAPRHGTSHRAAKMGSTTVAAGVRHGTPPTAEAQHCFLPPSPPSRHMLTIMLANGSPFESFYSILMTWYDRVVRTLSINPLLQTLPKCPPVSHYLHDFDGWLIQLEMWYSRCILPATMRAVKTPIVTAMVPPPLPPAVAAAAVWRHGPTPHPHFEITVPQCVGHCDAQYVNIHVPSTQLPTYF